VEDRVQVYFNTDNNIHWYCGVITRRCSTNNKVQVKFLDGTDTAYYEPNQEMRPCTHPICSSDSCYSLGIVTNEFQVGDKVVFKVSGEIGFITAKIGDVSVVNIMEDQRLVKTDQLRKFKSKGQQRRFRRKEKSCK
jgi:hypothetical protein